MSEVVDLLEFTRITKAREIDEDAGVLYDLVALGPVSENGRDYPDETQIAALPLLEGRQSFANHAKPGADPSVYDVLGVWRGLYVQESKTRGNFHYFKTHPLAPRLVEAARRPELNTALGFSICARGRTSERNGRLVVESLERVSSIDCVAQPATVSGMYESRTHPVKKKIKDLAESLKAIRPKYALGLTEALTSGVMGPDAMMDEPPATAAGDGDHDAALLDAAALVLKDETMSTAEKLKKIKEILKIVDGSKGAAPEPGEPDAAAEESRRKDHANLREENARLKARELVRNEADKAGVRVSATLLENLNPTITAEQATKLVAELKGTTTPARQEPRSAAPWREEKPPAPAGATVVESKTADALTDEERRKRNARLRQPR